MTNVRPNRQEAPEDRKPEPGSAGVNMSDDETERRTMIEVFFRDILSVRQDLQLHHKIVYVFLVFTGLVLVWYGLWGMLAKVPLLNNPVVAFFAGIGALVFTGTFFRQLG